jgi:acetyltransferase-like isoleucine patch superfamily enzyme
MISKITDFIKLPFYEKFNMLDILYYKLKTQLFYKLFFQKIGRKSVIKKPLILKNVDKISIGKGVFIRDGIRMESIENGRINIGDNVSFGQNCHITAYQNISIGKNTLISFNAVIMDNDHEYREIDKHILHEQGILSEEVYIGENCFIGNGAKIQIGSRLGKQCIVGASSLVKGTFPDYSVIVGIPAKIVKRYSLKSKQWEKTDPKGNFLQ